MKSSANCIELVVLLNDSFSLDLVRWLKTGSSSIRGVTGVRTYLQKKLPKINAHQIIVQSNKVHTGPGDHQQQDDVDWSENVSEKSDGDRLECRFMGNVLDSESGSELDAVKERAQDVAREEVIVEHVRSEGGLEGVEVLRVRHRRGYQGARWRDVEVTASVLNYKPSLRRVAT